MKNTNIIILIIIGLSLAVVWIYFSKTKEQKNIQEQWKTLLQSNDSNSEILALKRLTEIVSKHNGYWEVIGITKHKTNVNMIDYEGKLDDLLSVEINFYWNDKKFNGKNWIPINKKNIYFLFEDK